jgi:hypothetical protein
MHWPDAVPLLGKLRQRQHSTSSIRTESPPSALSHALATVVSSVLISLRVLLAAAPAAVQAIAPVFTALDAIAGSRASAVVDWGGASSGAACPRVYRHGIIAGRPRGPVIGADLRVCQCRRPGYGGALSDGGCIIWWEINAMSVTAIMMGRASLLLGVFSVKPSSVP